MKLDLAAFPVKDLHLGRRFAYAKATLEMDESELVDLVLQDSRITEAWLAVAMPGEKTRITGIRDIVEPRIKVLGNGQVFPGVLGPVADVGEGTTHRLSGMTVIAAAAYEGTIRAGTTVRTGGGDLALRCARASGGELSPGLWPGRTGCAYRDSIGRIQSRPTPGASNS
jgi:glycine reductase